MSTMTIIVSDVESVKPVHRANTNDLVIKCDMTHRDMEDIVAQVCEQMGDEEFMNYINRMMT